MEKGYDAGKKVSGIKRHIAVDTQGLPHALAVTTADVTDRKGGLLALERDRDNLGTVQKVLADGGYTGKAFASSVQELIGAEVEIAKRNELHRFAVDLFPKQAKAYVFWNLYPCPHPSPPPRGREPLCGRFK